MTLAATVRDLRRSNRARVLRAIVLAKRTTRAELAAACRVSTGTITNVVSDLISEGIVHEVGWVPSDGGRPIAQLEMRPEGGYLIGVGLGEHGVRAELFDMALTRVDNVRERLPSSINDVADVAQALAAAVGSLRERNPQVESALVGMGLGVPGLVDEDADGITTIYADHLGWPATPVRDLYDEPGLPIRADNGARALTMAEQWFGAARSVDHAVVALIGRGVSVGIIAGGRLLYGVSNGAGEWGHSKVQVNGRLCACGDRGCLDAYVGGGSVASRWSEGHQPASGGIEDTFETVLAAAEEGNTQAVDLVDETAEYLGVGLGNLVNLVNPEKIIIGGWSGIGLYAARGDDIRASILRHALPRPGKRVSVTASSFGRDALPLGAALLTLEQFVEGKIARPMASA